MPPLIDTHCHIDLAEFKQQRDLLLKEAWQADVSAIVIPAIIAKDFDHLLAIAATDRRLFACSGLHPLFMANHSPADFDQVAAQADMDTTVAIGECGLDYTRNETDKYAQQALFDRHVALAASCGKPLIIHANKAVEDVILTLRKYPGTHGIVHSFNGSLQQAERLIELGYSLGFGGAITYPRATRLRQLVTQLPLQAIVLETDAPFQSGFQHSSEINRPAWIVEVLETVASLKNLPEVEVARATSANAAAIFALPHDKQVIQ